jgi:hypothetical protein
MVGVVQAFVAKHKPYGVITLRNNWVNNVYSGFQCNMANSAIENNLLTNIDTFGLWASEGMGGCSTQGFSNNSVRHNTIISKNGPAIILDKPDDSCSNGGARSNIIKDNILITKLSTTSSEKQPIVIWVYNNGLTGHNNSLDYNLYYQPSTNRLSEYGTLYSYSTWKSRYSSDSHSLSASPTFVNPATPISPSDYALLSSSPGKGASSDGSDIGINAAAVFRSGAVDMVKPGTPTGVSVKIIN